MQQDIVNWDTLMCRPMEEFLASKEFQKLKSGGQRETAMTRFCKEKCKFCWKNRV